jgi:hypothetical protein
VVDRRSEIGEDEKLGAVGAEGPADGLDATFGTGELNEDLGVVVGVLFEDGSQFAGTH